VEEKLENVKKRAVTPLKGTPKRRRMSTAENLICSTEKLKSATKTTPKRIPVFEKLVSSIEKLKIGMYV